MMVRQYEETRRSHFVIGLSRSLNEYATADDFELGISAAGSIGLRALRDSQRVDVRVQGRELPAGTGKQLLGLPRRRREQQGEGGRDRRPRRHRLGHDAARQRVVLVCGSQRALRRPPPRLLALPFGAKVLAVVTDTTATAPTLRRIGDADVVTVGALEQIPLALQKVLA